MWYTMGKEIATNKYITWNANESNFTSKPLKKNRIQFLLTIIDFSRAGYISSYQTLGISNTVESYGRTRDSNQFQNYHPSFNNNEEFT